MKKFRIKTLQQRIILFLLVPVIVGLLASGFIGFLYARKVMLKQWQESARLKLERAAHFIDMRLNQPYQWLQLLSNSREIQTRRAIIEKLKASPGIVEVKIAWNRQKNAPRMHGTGSHHAGSRMMHFHRAAISEITQPVYDSDMQLRTVTMITSLLAKSGAEIGRIDLKIKFDYLIEDIADLGWWQTDLACLVSRKGNYLIHTNETMSKRLRLGDTGNPLEIKLLEIIPVSDSGTLMGEGHPPKMIAGYHSLKNAPWTIIIFADGRQVLEPIVQFRNYFFSGGLVLLLFILFIIRINIKGMVKPIRQLSQSSEEVAKGNYSKAIIYEKKDEIGVLVHSYNMMVEGLKERDFIRNTFGRYMDEDVARELLSKPELIKLGGDKREVVILISDIRGFTALSEVLSPEDTIQMLNKYFEHMIGIIKIHRGIIVDFVGDSVLSFFDPGDKSITTTAKHAVSCAIEMQAELKRFNKEAPKLKLPALDMGIGMNIGQVIVGNIGSKNRVKYGIVGSPVNLTQRIQQEARGHEVLVSEALYRHLSGGFDVERTSEVSFKGVLKPLKIYAIDKK
jgi:class 3 adenylate cyclase